MLGVKTAVFIFYKAFFMGLQKQTLVYVSTMSFFLFVSLFIHLSVCLSVNFRISIQFIDKALVTFTHISCILDLDKQNKFENLADS